jgi:hypothetical protein
MKIQKPLVKLSAKEQTLTYLVSTNKVSDSASAVSKGGRLDAYYAANGFRDFAAGGQEELTLKNTPQKFVDKFGLKGVEFGNWVTNEDRANFLEVATTSLPNFCKVVGIPSKLLGLKGFTGIAYGARGKSRALAHFEPGTGMINLTRYGRTSDIRKPSEFFKSGGLGSYSHEWGHALDYFLGTFVDRSTASRALTYGSTVIGSHIAWKKYDALKLPKGSYRWIVRELLASIIYTKRGVEFTPYFGKLLETVKKSEDFGEYWIRNNELFARAWEQYIDQKMTAKKLNKGLFTSQDFEKYSKADIAAYMKADHLKKVTPWFDMLLQKFSKDILSKG